MEQTPISVSDAVALVNQTLEYAFPTLVVEGEVASYKVNQGKFVFFDIKDEQSTLGCFMMLFSLRTALEDGMRVQVVATPKLTAWGRFSLTVREVRPVGEGNLKRAFELQRARLEAEGLFAPERKRVLPQFPARVGVISSTDAAGYKDFVKIVNSRWGGLDIQVVHTAVQGASAAEQIIGALNWFNQQANPVEVVVIVRGGGSADDLSVFNDELLVRAIAASRAPTLVGVGHEVDVTLADMVADMRAATPTDAAQRLVPDKREVAAAIEYKMRHVVRGISAQHDDYRQHVDERVETALRAIERRYASVKERFEMLGAVVQQLDPRSALRRGYALVFDAEGVSLGKRKPKKHDILRVETRQFDITTEVKDVRKKSK